MLQILIEEYINQGGVDIYCDLIIPKKISVDIIYESEKILAFRHTKPIYEHHFVVIPKDHVLDILDDSFVNVQMEVFQVIKMILSEIDYQRNGARVETNIGAFQKSKHLHFHVLAGASL